MQMSGEKLFLQWNDFRDNVSSAFKDLRDDQEFTDVTLACEGGSYCIKPILSKPFEEEQASSSIGVHERGPV